MEQNCKQQQLLFDKGITNVPSDASCSDNALEECMGLTYDGEHKVIQNPKVSVTLASGYQLLYIHTYNGVTRYIAENNNALYWSLNGTSFTSLSISNPIAVESIGNSLIVSTSAGLYYLVWNSTNSSYKLLGNRIPDIQVTFKLGDFTNVLDYQTHYIRLDGMVEGYEISGAGSFTYIVAGNKWVEGQYDNAKSALIGLVASRLKTVKSKARFAFPFWARSAVRMYDGSHINISNPFLLLPTVLKNIDIFVCDDDGDERSGDSETFPGGWPQTNYKPWSAKLYYQVSLPSGVSLSDWSDIIRGVDIYVSDEAKNFDMEGDWSIENSGDTNYQGGFTLADACVPEYTVEKSTSTHDSLDRTTWKRYYRPTINREIDIINQLISNSVFYKVFELDLTDLSTSGWIDSTDKIARNTLENLTTQTQLEYDDYFSRTEIVPQIMKTYNHRLHMANVTRSFFEGFTDFSFTTYASSGSATLYYYVYIKSESGERIVSASVSGRPDIADVWFYYPDPRAYKVKIYVGGGNTKIAELSLKEHPGLNGAYYFSRLPHANEAYTTTTETAPTTNTTPELLEDQLLVSEVDNPYVFTAKGYINVGMGTIIGMASQTMALGEQEHGIHPLTVFTEKGISLIRLASDGTYTRSDEISREVCNNVDSITEVDGPVFFSSEKGLMVVAGSDVKCVSEQLTGKATSPFQTYLKTAFIAYDYRDSLLWIFNGSTVCWIYNIKSGTFSHYTFTTAITNIVNNYPDFLLQAGTSVYTLLDRDNINADTGTYTAQIITRPMKLENALALKSIRQLRNIRQMEGTILLTIKASNNLSDWQTLTSLRGEPWKYYKFQYDFSDLTATDCFAGTVLITQERRTNKLR